MTDIPAEKPIRLYKKSYLQVVRNSVGSNMFRNFYVKTADKGEFDAFSDGKDSCAFFVSAVLVIFRKIGGIHGLVDRVVKDMQFSGWVEVDSAKPGDVLVWEAIKVDGQLHQHIGFYIGKGQAISNSSSKKTPVKHDMYFGDSNRKITKIFRLLDWENDGFTQRG